ncbi:MAG: EboA family metabolite traffic protein [Rhizonema sp. NSF051]|nr:EboA family metabolite traffic protein [Rhizonema sp. NSF051]
MISTIEKTISITDLLQNWLQRQVTESGWTWLDQKRTQIKSGDNTRVFFTAFSSVPRYIGKNNLELTPFDLKAASAVRLGWFPGHWTVDQVARTLLVLAIPQDNATQYLRTLEQVFSAADVGELVALYQALPLLPFPELLQKPAAEGVRSNITAVFNAIALLNPYPAECLDDLAWNQIVLKALFVGSPLHLIQGLDQRANPELARMLVDYAHERWAAKRLVSPELWRTVGKFADSAIIADLERVIADPDPVQQAAAALALSDCPLTQAQEIQARYPHLQALIQAGELTWNSLRLHGRDQE